MFVVNPSLVSVLAVLLSLGAVILSLDAIRRLNRHHRLHADLSEQVALLDDHVAPPGPPPAEPRQSASPRRG